MKITEDVRKYAAEHGLTSEEAIESGMQKRRNRVPEERRRSLREDVTARRAVLSEERTLQRAGLKAWPSLRVRCSGILPKRTLSVKQIRPVEVY